MFEYWFEEDHTQETASAGKNRAIETQTPDAVSPLNAEVRQSIPLSDLEDEHLEPPSLAAESNDFGRSLQEPGTLLLKPPAAHPPGTSSVSAGSEPPRDITERTYFITEAAALVHSRDRRGELIAAYSTEDPYQKDLTLVCFAHSSRDLLEKLRDQQADHQKLLIHWGESSAELEQFPDVLGAYLRLKEAGKLAGVRQIDDVVQSLRSFFENERTKRGRPRQDALSERVQELRNSGHSWTDIQRRLNKETGVERTAGAYRNLLKSREKPDDT
jgi:hypothetical protein